MSAQQQGWLFSAFSWGYVLGMIPGGLLLRKIGSQRGFVIAVVSSSVLCGISCVLHSFNSLFFIRLCLGIAEAPLFPAAATMIRASLHPEFRGKATATIDAGSYVGSATVGLLFPFLISTGGWRPSMLLGPILGLVWFYGYSGFAISRQLAPVNSEIQLGSFKDARPRLQVPLQLIVISIVFAIYNFLKGFFLTWLPTFLKSGQSNPTVTWITVATTLPFVVAIGTEMCAGWLMDGFIKAGHSVGKVRRCTLIIGLGGAALVWFLEFANNPTLKIIILVISFAALIGISPALWALPGDLAHHSEQTAMYGATVNCIANIGGIASPIIVGSLVERQGDFSQIARILGTVAIIGSLLSLGVLRKGYGEKG